jgi:hypothetical protein
VGDAKGERVRRLTFSPAESEFEKILRDNGFMTATLKTAVKAPSIQGRPGQFIIIPDILAVDESGNGWCFEVKDEAGSSYGMRRIEMTHGYSGPAWFLEERKAKSYLNFSRAFGCPCVLAIGGRQRWRVGFFTRKFGTRIDYNQDIVAAKWRDPAGIPILFSVMHRLEDFLDSSDVLRREYWS